MFHIGRGTIKGKISHNSSDNSKVRRRVTSKASKVKKACIWGHPVIDNNGLRFGPINGELLKHRIT